MTTADSAPAPSPALAVWSTGDYRKVGMLLPFLSETLVEAVDLRAGERVLDVASGSGNAALAAARRSAVVTASDIVPELLEHARQRAAAELVELQTEVADAQALPFGDGAFDVVTSAIGVMFAPDQHAAADEIVRVVRPGGRVALASWCFDGFLGDFFGVTAKHAPPPAGAASPFRWGSPDGLAELFGDRVLWQRTERLDFRMRHASARSYIDLFAATYGPTMKALARLEPAGQKALLDDLEALITSYNVATDGTAAWDCAYLLAVGTVR